jgi:hypothetical protein
MTSPNLFTFKLSSNDLTDRKKQDNKPLNLVSGKLPQKNSEYINISGD